MPRIRLELRPHTTCHPRAPADVETEWDAHCREMWSIYATHEDGDRLTWDDFQRMVEECVPRRDH